MRAYRHVKTILGLARERAAAGHLPFGRQVWEMLGLRALRGLDFSYYQAGGLWRKDIPWRDKLKHLNEKDYIKRIWEINPRPYHKLSQCKVAEKGILDLFGIPTPDFLGLICPLSGCAGDGSPLRNPAEVEAFLAGFEGERLCFKLLEGWGGREFRAAWVGRGAGGICLKPLSGQEAIPAKDYFAADFAGPEASPIVIEHYFEQHPDIAAFHPQSVNTLRIYALQKTGAYPQVLGGFLRMGRGVSMTDSTSGGGICAKVDVASGVLLMCTDAKPAYRTFDTHPDTGTCIVGAQVPFWAEAKDLTCRALSLFPNINFAGIDVAIGPQGPVIIEMNVQPDRIGMPLLDRPPDELLRL